MGLGNSSQGRQTQLQICSAIYDALVDDDNEIREKAAEVASRLLKNAAASSSVTNLSTAAAVTPDLIVNYLTSYFAETSDLFVEGLARLLGLPIPTQLQLRDLPDIKSTRSFCSLLEPPADILNASAKQNTSLFVEEKQNLFRDDVVEIERWRKMLCNIPIKTVALFDLVPLLEWATNGIRALVNSARNHSGGALGWGSKPDIFVVLARGISITEVVLRWTSRPEARSQSSSLRHFLLYLDISEFQDSIHPLCRNRLMDLVALARDQSISTV